MRTKRNVLALWGLWAFLKHHPEQHDQTVWISATPVEAEPDHDDPNFTCGTTGCAAGWVCLLAGDRLDFEGHTDQRHFSWIIDGETGQFHNVRPRAEQLLGISHPVGVALFSGGNQLRPLLKALKKLAQGVPDREVIMFLHKHNNAIGIDILLNDLEPLA